MPRVKVNKSKIIIMWVLLSGVAGCAVTVKPVPAPVLLPTRFSGTGQQKLPEQWWLAFNDQQLNRLCERALSGNFSLLTAFNRLQQARAIAKKTGADLIPQVNAVGSAGTATNDSPAANDFGLGLSASYEVDLWGRIRSAVNAAKLDVDAAEEDIFSAAITLTATVASTWYQLVEQRQQLKLLDQQIEVNKSNVLLVKVKFAGAQASAADVFQQQQLLESVTGSRYSVIANIAVLENELAVLTGRAPGMVTALTGDIYPALPPLPQTGLSLALMQRRPDIRKAYVAVQAADQRIASAIADRFPKLSLSAETEVNSPNFQSILNNWLATIAGNLVLPVIDGSRRVAEVERNRAVAAEAVNNYATVMLAAVKEVENALVQERQQHSVVSNLTRQVELARQATSIIKIRYMNGVSDFLRVLSATLSQQSLERNLLQAQQQLLAYRINLYRSLAGRFPLTKSKADTGYQPGKAQS